MQVEEIQRMGALLGDEEVRSCLSPTKDWMDGILFLKI